MSVFYKRRSAVNLWKRFFPRTVEPGECLKCGLCARLCPERGISIDPGSRLPVLSGSCALCLRCFYQCPAGAIRIAGRAPAVPRAASLAEMLEGLGERA